MDLLANGRLNEVIGAYVPLLERSSDRNFGAEE